MPPDVAEKIVTHTRRAIELREAKRARRDDKRARLDDVRRRKRGDDLPVPDRLRKIRARMASYVGTSVFLVGVNYFTGDGFWWCVFPIMGIGMGVLSDLGRLWADGIPLRALFDRNAIALGSGGDANAANHRLQAPVSAADEALPAGVGAATMQGPFGAVLRQGITDHKTVNDLAARLTDAERKMLPDVQATADALFARLVALASGLHRLDEQLGGARLPDLDARIAQLEQGSGNGSATSSRPLTLLRRQRDMLAELTASRAALLEQYESAGLLLQNLALDMLKVRSSGLDSALGGITSATQEARALSKEIGYALDAAEELKALEQKR